SASPNSTRMTAQRPCGLSASRGKKQLHQHWVPFSLHPVQILGLKARTDSIRLPAISPAVVIM
ncbi:hypothetical protein, partial [Blastomonas sp. UPD001]|uniref:hypothetical protein n=1 Tax=Blastomonas sp. UPD001 TaxID=2217673 RepID=UPI001E5F9828